MADSAEQHLPEAVEGVEAARTGIAATEDDHSATVETGERPPQTGLEGSEVTKTVSASPAAAAAAAAPLDDDDDDGLGLLVQNDNIKDDADHDAAAAHGETAAPHGDEVEQPQDADGDDPSDAEEDEHGEPPLPEDLTMADLFGTFKPNTHQDHPEDPLYFDVLQIARDVFGNNITEMEIFEDLHIDVDLDDHRAREVTEHKRLDDVQPLLDVFGDDALAWFAHDIVEGGRFEHARVVECSRPENPLGKAHRRGLDDLWLLEMPKVHPNRQVLHLSETPFERCMPRPPSNPRQFFTPQNVIHWTKKKDGTVLSNARLVRWSDGTATMNIGSDVYELPENTDRALTMLARPVTLADGRGHQSTVLVEAVPIMRHVSVIPAPGRPSSVSDALVQEFQIAKGMTDPAKTLPYTSASVPMLRTQQERNKAPGKHRELTDEEKFMEMVRAQRERGESSSNRAGGYRRSAMESIEDELNAYAALCQAVADESVATLVQQKDLELQQEKLRQRAGRPGYDQDGNRIEGADTTRPSRFERTTDVLTSTGAAGASGNAVDDEEGEDDTLDDLLNRRMGDAAAIAPESNGKRGRGAEGDAEDPLVAELEAQRSTIHVPARSEE